MAVMPEMFRFGNVQLVLTKLKWFSVLQLMCFLSSKVFYEKWINSDIWEQSKTKIMRNLVFFSRVEDFATNSIQKSLK